MSSTGKARRSIACHLWMLNIPQSRQHYGFSNVGDYYGSYTPHPAGERFMSGGDRDYVPIIQKGLRSRSNQHRGVTDISAMTALFIGGRKGERADGIARWWEGGVYSQQGGDAHPLYDSYSRYSWAYTFKTEMLFVTEELGPLRCTGGTLELELVDRKIINNHFDFPFKSLIKQKCDYVKKYILGLGYWLGEMSSLKT